VAEELATRFGEQLQAITLQPSHGGIFEVTLGERVLFRKADEQRFPDQGEIGELVAASLG
jgi:selT/selW/selH-like putative selenoprotein